MAEPTPQSVRMPIINIKRISQNTSVNKQREVAILILKYIFITPKEPIKLINLPPPQHNYILYNNIVIIMICAVGVVDTHCTTKRERSVY